MAESNCTTPIAAVIPLPRRAARQPVGVPEHRMRLLHITTNGMRPTIGAGDLVEIDTAQIRIEGDGVYLIEIGGTPELRRVQPMPDGDLLIWIDSHPKAAHRVAPGAAHVLGRVTKIWAGHNV